MRANDEWVRIFLGTKEVSRHRRDWRAGQDVEDAAHRQAALQTKPGAQREGLPPMLQGMGEVAVRYFKIAAAGTKSLHRETVRLVFLAEVYGPQVTAEAMSEVMQSGHVGADYVEYVLRQNQPPVRRGEGQ